MKIIALYKTFDGDEFIEASLASIYEHVDKIVMVHSSTGWTGEKGNTVRPVVEGWRERHDYADKLHHVDVDVTTQDEQYLAGVEYILSQGWQYDLLMLVDADEVWDDGQLLAAIDEIKRDGKRHVGYQVHMEVYLKSIFYRVTPRQGTPIAFLRDPAALFRGARAWNVEPKKLLGVHFHHFTYVRRSTAAVRRKIEQSCAGDDAENTLDLNRWFADKWAKLPFARHLHPFAGRDDFWPAVERVWLDALPVTVQNNAALISQFLPPGELLPREEPILFDIARDVDLCVDLGTLAGRSAAIFALAAKRVVTIDLFELLGNHAESDEPGALEHERLLSEFNLRRDRVAHWLRQYPNIEIIQSTTAAAAKRFHDESIDVLFIDAGHDAKSITIDLFVYLPKVKRGGIIVMHDVNEAHPAVLRLAERIKGEVLCLVPADLGSSPGSLRAFMKVS